MDDAKRVATRQLVREVFNPELSEDINDKARAKQFGDGIYDLAMENVFGGLWLREGLDRRSRSLVTLGILIASGATDELRIHAIAATRNGVTVPELEEVIYHATAYAGFPAANSARRQIAAALHDEGIELEG